MSPSKKKLELTCIGKEKRYRKELHIWLEERVNLYLAQAHRLSLSGRHNWKRLHQGLAWPVRLAQLNAIATHRCGRWMASAHSNSWATRAQANGSSHD